MEHEKSPLYLIDQKCRECHAIYRGQGIYGKKRIEVTDMLRTSMGVVNGGERQAYEVFKDICQKCDHGIQHKTINQTLGDILRQLLVPKEINQRGEGETK